MDEESTAPSSSINSSEKLTEKVEPSISFHKQKGKRSVGFIVGLAIIVVIGILLGYSFYNWKQDRVTVYGTIADIVENPLANQSVQLTSGSSSYQTTANQSGEFRFSDVPRQTYVLTATYQDEEVILEIDLRSEAPPFDLNIPVLTDGFDFMPPAKLTDVEARSDGTRAIKNEIVVRWQEDATLQEREQIINQAGATLLSDTPEINLSLLTVDNAAVDSTIEQLNVNTKVVIATPSYILETNIIPKEEAYKDINKSWWLKTVNAEPAWDISLGSPYQLVGVVDGGFTLDHADLEKAFVKAKANYTSEAGYVSGSHGTHVTGIIGMRMNNNEGLTGIAPNTRMAVAKTWSMARAADAFRFFSRCPSVKVVSISMGNNWWSVNKRRRENGLAELTEEQKRTRANATDQILEPAVKLLASKDKLLVHSAGNDSGDASLNTLNFDEVLTVASTNYSDGLADFSNKGARVDVAAPGVQIYSTVPDTYDYKSGTSMSTPLVAGTAALIRAKNPKLKYDQVKKVIVDTADPVEGLKDHHFGRLDVWRALLKSTKQLGVEGFVFDGITYDLVEGAKITDFKTANVLSEAFGFYRISALPWQKTELKASKGNKWDKEIVVLPQDDVVDEIDFELLPDELEPTPIPTVTPTPTVILTPTPPPDVYVVWEGTNASVGLNITTQVKFEADELASSYSGGGISDTLILEKKKFIDSTFASFEEANTSICRQLTDVRSYPFIGLGGKYNDAIYIIGNFSCD